MTSGFSKMAVFARFCLIWRILPFFPVFTLPRTPLGTTNSQESLEIIIYIKTASQKKFFNVMTSGFSKMALFPVFAQFEGFARSFFFRTLDWALYGKTNSQENLEFIIYIQTASHKILSM